MYDKFKYYENWFNNQPKRKSAIGNEEDMLFYVTEFLYENTGIESREDCRSTAFSLLERFNITEKE